MAHDWLQPHYKVILAGARGVGKTTLYEYLIKNVVSGGTLTYQSLGTAGTSAELDKWLLSVPGERGSKITVRTTHAADSQRQHDRDRI